VCIFYENSFFIFLIGCFLCTSREIELYYGTKIETDFAKNEKGERMQKERKKERKKENYCNSASYTQTSYTRAEREKGKERVESAGIGRSSSAFFIFSRSTSF